MHGEVGAFAFLTQRSSKGPAFWVLTVSGFRVVGLATFILCFDLYVYCRLAKDDEVGTRELCFPEPNIPKRPSVLGFAGLATAFQFRGCMYSFLFLSLHFYFDSAIS